MLHHRDSGRRWRRKAGRGRGRGQKAGWMLHCSTLGWLCGFSSGSILDITRPSGDADGYSAEIAVILGTACPGYCHGSHASTGCGAHWHMVPAPSAWSPQCLCPLCPGFPWLTLHTMVTPERAVQYFTRTLQPCMCRGEARSVTRGVTTCSCSGEVLLSEAQVRWCYAGM